MNEDYRIFAQYVRPERPVNVTMAGISDCDRSYCIYRPEYSRYVIEHTVSGSGILEAGGEVCPIHAGDTYFLYGGRPHKYYCSGESWKKLWVVLDGEVAASLFHAYLPDQPNVLHDFDVYTEMQNIIALTRDSFCSYEEMVNRIVLIVHRILIAANARSGKPDSNPEDIGGLPEQIRTYIDDHLDEPLRLDVLSKHLFFSKNHIIHVFREAYGCTPYVYYERQKLSAARELLLAVSDPICNISDRLGFDSPQYFSKRFKTYFGVTPFQFRRGKRQPAEENE